MWIMSRDLPEPETITVYSYLLFIMFTWSDQDDTQQENKVPWMQGLF